MQRKNYIGSPFLGEHVIDIELVEQVVSSMQRGKAAGLGDLSTEHLLYCHPLLLCILAKFKSNQIKSNLINNKGLKAIYRLLRHRLKQ